MIKLCKKLGIFSVAILLVVSGCSTQALAVTERGSSEEKGQTSENLAEKYDHISQNCVTIKQSLSQLQKVDSRARTYLGQTYETISSKFITPLNLRLVKNNLPTIPNIQSDFSVGQNKFRDAYTDYMRELESLIAIDCHENSTGFYSQLIIVRAKRETLRLATNRLTTLANNQYQAVRKMRESL